MKTRLLVGVLYVCVALIGTASRSFAVLGNCWHFPQNGEPVGVTSMRTPLTSIPPSAAVALYQGAYLGDGANETGGTLFYKRSTDGSWSSLPLGFDANNGANQYWKATIPANTFSEGDYIQYYVQVNFSNRDTTYIYGSDAFSFATGTQATAQASPFVYRVRTVTILWPGVGYASDPAGSIHHWKEEAIIGNGYITAQLDQNGSLYDIYYPSVGNRHGVSTSNEGYRGPEEFPGCPSLDQEANGQMNVIAGMGGIAIPLGGTNYMYWLQNTAGTDYVNVGQRYVTDNNVVYTTNVFVGAGKNILVEQYDFCPVPSALPIVSDGTRTNYGVYVKRFLLTNQQGSSQTFAFYYDVNFNVNGGNGHDVMYFDTRSNQNAMVVFDNSARTVPVQVNSCDPNGYTTEYSPSFSFGWGKSSSVFFGTVMKEVTNAVTGAGSPADGSWRDVGATVDHQEGWIGKTVTLAGGQTKEIDVMIVGSWDDFANANATHDFWGRPLIDWFYANNMSNVQTSTETYWSNWLNSGVTVDFPENQYDVLFKRSLLVTALHIDKATGSIIAGMHNGAYPFVWPRDGVYAAITLDRTGHSPEAERFYRWMRDVAFRYPDQNPGGKSFFFQKYTTDGYFVWTSPQIDETASVPWGIYYHYLTTGDSTFVTNYWQLARESAYASYYTSTNNGSAYYDFNFNLMNGNNVWEDSFGLFIYSNASIVRGLRDAANLADLMGSSAEASAWRSQADTMRNSGIIPRVNARVEPADISHLGLVVPYEVFTPTDGVMQAIAEWIHGNGSAVSTNCNSGAGFNDDLEEHGNGIAGLWRRYNHNVGCNIDNYWNGGPWFLATSWYGEYNARWQDYAAGSTLVDVNLGTLSNLVSRLGPVGLASEQISPDYAQKYPGFWLQTAWPNVWESHSTLVDQMMMFLDYKPAGTNNNNACYFAPKLPSTWNTMTFNNLNSQGQRFNVTITKNSTNTRADINKLTSGALSVDVYLRIPAGMITAMVVTNGSYYVPSPSSYDTTTGRVHVQCALTSAAGTNSIIVTYGNNDYDGDGLPDSWEIQYGFSPIDNGSINPNNGANADPDGDGMSNLQEYLAGTNPTNGTSALRVTAVRLEGNDIRITWSAGGGTTNMLQYAPGNPGYTTNFIDLPSQVVLPGSGDVTTNKVDFGGATNVPARFYRIKLLP